MKNTEAYDVFEQSDSDDTDSSWGRREWAANEDDAKQNKKANSPFKERASICRLKSDVKFQNFFLGHF